MATRDRIPLVGSWSNDTAAGPIAEGSDDDLGMNSDYDYNSDSSVEGIIFTEYSQTFIQIIAIIIIKFLNFYTEHNGMDMDLGPAPASPELSLSCENLQCMQK